ncbi:MAG: ABC transporter substrate-binding protein [Hyphomicrobiaceae bacterium]|nr:MAG: ABC transporter substrate-binding protein [Hyphomicrobiaceae bacterium]
MKSRPGTLGAGFVLAAAAVATLALIDGSPRAAQPVETPSLAELVAQKKLPPVDKRLPSEPRAISFKDDGRKIGKHGGTLNQLMGRANDIRRMSAFGYTRLVVYDRNYKLVPDILKSFEVKDGREFTFVLREGHKWSDGQPLTSEDIRYWWEDMVLNAELSPAGPPAEMLVNGKPPQFKVINKTTVQFIWDAPNPYFLHAIAGATPLCIYRPSHYLKRFHKKYAKANKLAEQIKKRKRRDWVDLHFNRDRVYRLDNPDYPSLDPWVNTTAPPADRFIFERNPYFHRVDEEGHQLPYLDRVAVTIANPRLIPPRASTGEAELQSRGLQFNNYTLLKRGEPRGFDVRLWPQTKGSQLALYPNFNAADPAWRALIGDVRFRRALSLGINRREINQVIYYGLAREGNNTVLPESPLYKPEFQTKWAAFDPKKANALLDEMGLTKRDGRGVRLMADGRPIEIIVETAGEETEHTDVLQLLRDTWAEIGVALFPKPMTRELLRRRATSGQTIMSVFNGLDNGIPRADFAPTELVPSIEEQLQWPKWGLWVISNGKNGEAPTNLQVKRLIEHRKAWETAKTDEERARLWQDILSICADQVFTIGIVNAVPQPVVISRRLKNVPEKALYSWDPGAHFGIFQPDTFWLEGKESS